MKVGGGGGARLISVHTKTKPNIYLNVTCRCYLALRDGGRGPKSGHPKAKTQSQDGQGDIIYRREAFKGKRLALALRTYPIRRWSNVLDDVVMLCVCVRVFVCVFLGQ